MIMQTNIAEIREATYTSCIRLLAWAGQVPGSGMESRNAGMEERMKRIIIVMAVLVFAIAVPLVFAQGTTGSASSGNGLDKSVALASPADLYPVRLDVTRVYIHTQGYKVVYRKGESSFAEVFIPSTWFVPGGKAVLVRGKGPQFPYMFVYYKEDGSFNHLKLFVMQSFKDPSWGIIEGDPGDKFKVETIKLEF
jgi:hypothetical protein